jgi:hypothetical protein
MVFRVYGVVILWGLEGGGGGGMIPFYCCFRPQEVVNLCGQPLQNSLQLRFSEKKKEIISIVFRH